ncbi:MAG: hypothetical protein Gaeavirus25_8 [Gaeavirus sp.]|uniref:Uncharacterized protein n=1 Tax=Gaeavirus sp. TaxID=2487767 RepID=A0A3G5A490_9VIRU|nr:MAG: hypothetical protein Gaeavirus25_8 [Gaeavirus sp.]
MNNQIFQVVQFGSENIDKLDMTEALKIYMQSTGGNILSNILKFINLNEKYPENHNICMSDLSREFVKVYNGKKFITKKFKNCKDDILGSVIKNTNKIVDKFENNDAVNNSPVIKSKISVNKTSVKLIKGDTAEDIVREESRSNRNVIDTNSDDEEIDFSATELARIKLLEQKQQGLQDISFDKLKNELYNGKDLVENSIKNKEAII